MELSKIICMFAKVKTNNYEIKVNKRIYILVRFVTAHCFVWRGHKIR